MDIGGEKEQKPASHLWHKDTYKKRKKKNKEKKIIQKNPYTKTPLYLQCQTL